jgi:hypothetical protein
VIRFRRALPALLLLTAALAFSCHPKGPGTEPGRVPDPPTYLSATTPTSHSILLNWSSGPRDQSGFFVYLRSDTAARWTIVDTTSAIMMRTVVDSLRPSTRYHFRVTAYNQWGESEPSNEATLTTAASQIPPNAPTDVRASAQDADLVRLNWTDRGTQDSFLIQRREPSTAWVQIASTRDNIETWDDSTVAPVTHYYYRVGAFLPPFTAWSDSAEVTTPTHGAPIIPDSLTIHIVVGVGVVLHWQDRSHDETRFDIGRAQYGQLVTVIDTVPANDTTYFDSLGPATGNYYYRVRSANAYGVSAWTDPAAADYFYCSDGVLPLCRGNYWEYRVDSVGVPSVGRYREVIDVAFPRPGLDFYLIGERSNLSNDHDSLYYVRNEAVGTVMTPFPLDTFLTPDTLYRFHPGEPSVYYHVGADCVQVLGYNQTVQLTDSTIYTGCVSYQRFFEPGHSVQIWIKPNTIGVVRELEYIGTTDHWKARRDLILYQVLNDVQ